MKKYLLILCMTLLLSSAEIIVHTPSTRVTLGGVTIHFFNSTLAKHFSANFTLKKDLVFIDQTSILKTEDITDKIVLSPLIFGIDDQARKFQRAGAMGIIMASAYSSPEGKANYQLSHPRREMVFPSVQLNRMDYLYLRKLVKTEAVVVEMVWTEFEMNPFYGIMYWYGIMGYVLGAIFFGVVGVGCVVLFVCNYVMNEKATVTIKLVLLGAIFLTNLIRLLYCCLDPFGSQLLLPWQVVLLLYLVNIPASIMCEFLLTMYWLLRLRKFIKRTVCPCSMQIPIAILAGFYFVMLVIIFMLSILDPIRVFNLLGAFNVFYGFSWAALSIMYLIVAICVFRRLQKIRVKRRAKYKPTFLFKVFGICFLDFVMIFVIFSVLIFEISPVLTLTTNFSLILLTYSIGISVIAAVTPGNPNQMQ